jgi:membrane protease YdiL (CAAX protease family)
VQKEQGRKRIRGVVQTSVIVLLCALTVALDFFEISYVKDEFRNKMIGKLVQQVCGATAAILLMLRWNIRLLGKPRNLWYVLPCLLVAIDNVQFSAYFNGRMELMRTSPINFILFGGYCMAVGLFEECIFRGVIFALLASCFSKDKKGFLKTYFLSSLSFGVAHLFNGFSLGTLLQVVYTILTGGLFAFCLVKTKNVICCAFVHGLYNFCGLLFDTQGLGTGVVFDVGTVVTMTIVGVCVGIFVLYSVFKYSEEERCTLYGYLGIKTDKNKE